MRKFRLLPVIAVSTALMMGITGCESTTQKPAKEELKITIDVIKEITKLSAKTEDQKQFIDISCELVKVFIDKEGK